MWHMLLKTFSKKKKKTTDIFNFVWLHDAFKLPYANTNFKYCIWTYYY